MDLPLTDRQKTILAFIRRHSEERGYPPTVREIGEEFGIRSPNGVADHLKALEKKGFLRRDESKSRGLIPISSGVQGRHADNDDGTIEVPIVGKVAAGAPILAEENITDHVRVDSFLLGGSTRVFGLKVTGDSMTGDGINDGDYVFVRKQLTARTNEIVVAMIEGEATVKHFVPEGDRIKLVASNPKYSPIVVRKSDFRDTQILGVVVGLYRKMTR